MEPRQREFREIREKIIKRDYDILKKMNGGSHKKILKKSL
jgi:hypothetical protein